MNSEYALKNTKDFEEKKSAINTETDDCVKRSTCYFKVKRSVGFMKNEEWNVSLTPDYVEFSFRDSNKLITVPKETANEFIRFPQEFALVPSGNIHVKDNKKEYVFVLNRADRKKLCNWLPKKTAEEMKGELRMWGVGLIVLGGVHFVLSEFLDPVWGIVIAVLGALNLLVAKRGMFIANGIALLFIGFLNMAAGGGWKIFGMLQIIWGVQEIRKFRRYA
jgi:hypothetical protein